jgi:hypothetical protein
MNQKAGHRNSMNYCCIDTGQLQSDSLLTSRELYYADLKTRTGIQMSWIAPRSNVLIAERSATITGSRSE